MQSHYSYFFSFSARYVIVVVGEFGSEFRTIVTAMILPMEVYKLYSKSLKQRNKKILRKGVEVIRAITTDDKSHNTGSHYNTLNLSYTAKSLFSEALLDDEEMDDLFELPLTYNTYWDPREKKIIVDKLLGYVSMGINLNVWINLNVCIT